MFNFNDKDFIKKVIDSRNDSEYIIPLYVKIYNDTYPILELDNINTFNPAAFKVGFGSSQSMFLLNSFPSEHNIEFNNVSMFFTDNEDTGVRIVYKIFESSYVDGDAMLYEQINLYVDLLKNKLNKQYQYRKKDYLDYLDE